MHRPYPTAPTADQGRYGRSARTRRSARRSVGGDPGRGRSRRAAGRTPR